MRRDLSVSTLPVLRRLDMNTSTRLRTWWLACVGAVLTAWALPGADFTEPPLVVYGRVVTDGMAGPGRLITSGILRLVLEDRSEPGVRIVRTPLLRPVGRGGQFSYLDPIPLNFRPDEFDGDSRLAVAATLKRYRIVEATVDGYPARLRDPSQLEELALTQAARAGEMRIDFEAAVPQADMDQDGMADDWEWQHGFDPRSSGDAGLDADQDGLSNLAEFLAGTHPNRADLQGTIPETVLDLPAGGESGFSPSIVVSGLQPENLVYHIADPVPGLTWRRSGVPLAPPASFSHAEALAGAITVSVASEFQSAPVQIELRRTGATPSTNQVTFQAVSYSPVRGMGVRPSAWLDAKGMASGSVWEWQDRSGNGREAFQPTLDSQPRVARDAVGFNPGRFVFWDDRDLRVQDFTLAFVASLDQAVAPVRTLFNGLGMELAAVGGSNSGWSLRLQENGRLTRSGPIGSEVRGMATHEGSGTRLDLMGQGTWISSSNSAVWPPAFPTLGAARGLAETTASRGWEGSIGEWILFEYPLGDRSRARLQDYLRAKWEGVVVWDRRMAVYPVRLQGRLGVPNALAGGVSDDVLNGADRADVLEGGAGDDRLSGGVGPDQFVFGSAVGDDVVTDFSVSQGDVLDLSGLFGSMSGPVAGRVRVRSVIRRDGNAVPRTDSILEIRKNGTASIPDQTITLEGVAWVDADLPRWVDQGVLRLGGLRFTEEVVWPVIDAAPQNLAARVDGFATFEVVASGGEPLGYQWFRDGRPIPGARTSRLTLSGLRLTDAGTYTVAVSNVAGIVRTEGARLEVARIPAALQIADLEQVFDGSPRCVTVMTDPPGLPVRISYDGQAACPTDPGTYRVVARIEDERHVGEISSVLSITDQVRPARLEAVVVNGFLVAVKVLDRGHGFSMVPLIQVTGGGGSGAELRAVVERGGIARVDVLRTGSGFSSIPQIQAEAPSVVPLRLGVTEALALSFEVVDPARTYRLQREVNGVWEDAGLDLVGETRPERWVTGSALKYRAVETPVPRTAIVAPTLAAGFLVGATVTDPGSGYTEAPKVRIVGNGAVGAVVKARINSGTVTDILVESTGTPIQGPLRLEVEPPPIRSLAPLRSQRGLELVVDGLIADRSYVLEAGPIVGGITEREVVPFKATNAVQRFHLLPYQPVRFFQLRQAP